MGNGPPLPPALFTPWFVQWHFPPLIQFFVLTSLRPRSVVFLSTGTCIASSLTSFLASSIKSISTSTTFFRKKNICLFSTSHSHPSLFTPPSVSLAPSFCFFYCCVWFATSGWSLSCSPFYRPSASLRAAHWGWEGSCLGEGYHFPLSFSLTSGPVFPPFLTSFLSFLLQ